jgi:hypothetical protein
MSDGHTSVRSISPPPPSPPLLSRQIASAGSGQLGQQEDQQRPPLPRARHVPFLTLTNTTLFLIQFNGAKRYHFSKGDPHRGCAGHGYDTCAARSFAFDLQGQIERVFGTNHHAVHPIVVGIETDEDSLVFHGKNDQVNGAVGVLTS